MVDDRIKWCFRQKGLVSLVAPNKNLAEGYLKKAEIAIEEIKNVKSNEWKIETAYYGIYHSIYALLIRTGLKSELHMCTISFVLEMFSDYFDEKEILVLKNSRENRKSSMYYVNTNIKDEDLKDLVLFAPKIFAKCKQILSELNQRKIESFLNKIRLLKNG